MEPNELDIKDEDIQEEDFKPEELENDATDWKAKALELKGIAKRRATQLKKAKIAAEAVAKLAKTEAPKESKSDDFGLLQKTYLRAAGITAEDEIELAKDIQKRTGLDWDKLPDDDYFKSKLENLRVSKANANATSNIKGDAGNSAAKNTPEYWIAKGEAPPKTSENRKLRADIMRQLMSKEKSGSKFYND